MNKTPKQARRNNQSRQAQRSRRSRQAQRTNEGGLRPKPGEYSLRARAVDDSRQSISGQAPGNSTPGQLDQLWDNILSRQPDLIRAAFATLDAPEQKTILTHLYRMMSESGWQPEQKDSAETAIQALTTQSNQEK